MAGYLRVVLAPFVGSATRTEVTRVRTASSLVAAGYTLRDCMQCFGVLACTGPGCNCTLKMLAEWFQPARLETRTKESNTYASSRVANLPCIMKVKVPSGLRWDPSGVHHRPTMIF